MDIFWQHVLQIFEYMLLSNKFQTNSEPGGLHTKQVQDFNKKKTWATLKSYWFWNDSGNICKSKNVLSTSQTHIYIEPELMTPKAGQTDQKNQGPMVSEVGTCQNAKYLGLAQKRLNSGNFY